MVTVGARAGNVAAVSDDALTEQRFWAQVVGDARRTVVCHPDDEARVRAWVGARGLEELITVQVSPYLPAAGQVIVVDTGAVQAEADRPRPIRLWP